MSESGRMIGPEPDPEQLFREAFMRAYASGTVPTAPSEPPPSPPTLSTGVMRRWWVLLLGALLGALTGYGVAGVLPPSYTASVTMIVQVPSSVSDTEAQVSTIEALATSATVLADVAQSTGTDLTPRAVGDRLELSRPTGSAVVEITVTDTDRRRARELAQAILPSLQSRLGRADLVTPETSGGTTTDENVTVRSFGPAQVQRAADPRLKLTVGGAVVGGGLGLLVAALLASRAEDRRRRGGRPGLVERRAQRREQKREQRLARRESDRRSRTEQKAREQAERARARNERAQKKAQTKAQRKAQRKDRGGPPPGQAVPPAPREQRQPPHDPNRPGRSRPRG